MTTYRLSQKQVDWATRTARKEWTTKLEILMAEVAEDPVTAPVIGGRITALKKRIKRDFVADLISLITPSVEDLTMTSAGKIFRLATGHRPSNDYLRETYGTRGRKADNRSALFDEDEAAIEAIAALIAPTIAPLEQTLTAHRESIKEKHPPRP